MHSWQSAESSSHLQVTYFVSPAQAGDPTRHCKCTSGSLHAANKIPFSSFIEILPIGRLTLVCVVFLTIIRTAPVGVTAAFTNMSELRIAVGQPEVVHPIAAIDSDVDFFRDTGGRTLTEDHGDDDDDDDDDQDPDAETENEFRTSLTSSVSAINELERVFGISHHSNADSTSGDIDDVTTEQTGDRPPRPHSNGRPRWARRRAPPEYMVELYNAVAYSDGISKTSNPYEADVVWGITDKATTHQVYYYFNISHINRTEELLEAELHLYKLRPGSRTLHQQRNHRSRGISSHFADVRIYQVMSGPAIPTEVPGESSGNSQAGPLPRPPDSTDGLRLVAQRRVSIHRHGWEVFKVRDVVRRWIDDPSTNHGFVVTATTADGEAVNGTLVRFAQRMQHHDSKQPVLIVFVDEKQQLSQTAGDWDEDVYQPPIVSDSNLKTMRRNYVNYLNEAHRAQHGSGPLSSSGTHSAAAGTPRRRRPHAYYMNPIVHQRLINETTAATLKSTNAAARRSRRSPIADAGRHGVRHVSGNGASPARRRKRTCQRHEMYVDFEKIGWSGWIISPKGYNAYQCRGVCPFPLGQNQHPSNHATVQSIVHALRIYPGGGGGSGSAGADAGRAGSDGGAGVDTPCCVPNKLYSISLLYFDDDENVILKQYDEMVAASCGCH